MNYFYSVRIASYPVFTDGSFSWVKAGWNMKLAISIDAKNAWRFTYKPHILSLGRIKVRVCRHICLGM
jgi:hypothetical protein